MSSPYLFDVTTDTFDRYVLENSFHKPVLVDFWADWCAPCKALLPTLTTIADSYAGELLLAKVNCDEEAALSERFGIRSLPTVVLFKDGQPVEGFAGIQPESAIRELLIPHIGAAPEPVAAAPEPADPAAEATTLLDTGAIAEAIALLQQAIAEQSSDALLLLLARALGEHGELDDAEQVLGAISKPEQHKEAISQLKTQWVFKRQAAEYPAAELLTSRLASDPHDSEAAYQLAILGLARQDYENAMGGLLGLMQSDRSYADGAAQKTLMQVFDLLGGANSLTIQYRRRLYQLLY
ncbi:MAG: thioredoxin [Halopseudomonas sp.]|uniref:thioredoxin n=1 Tax=Halopseudomonas sp. TaxID=2901191 RepID=UPI003003646D